jgi:hypothetical protein
MEMLALRDTSIRHPTQPKANPIKKAPKLGASMIYDEKY